MTAAQGPPLASVSMNAAGDHKWVVFDLGETLVDESRNWARWAEYLGVPVLTFFAVFGAVVAAGRPHTDVFSYFRPGFSLPEEVQRKAAAGLPWGFDEQDLYDDAIPALAELRAAGLQLAVMANQPLEAMPFLRTLPVDRVAISAEWQLEKPMAAFFERICSELDARPSDVAYVGDRLDNDVLPALGAGMTAVHLRRGPWGYLQRDVADGSAGIRLDNLSGLLDSLRRCGFVNHS